MPESRRIELTECLGVVQLVEQVKDDRPLQRLPDEGAWVRGSGVDTPRSTAGAVRHRDSSEFPNFPPGKCVLAGMRYLSSMQFHRGILTDQIPVQGFAGALVVAAMIVAIRGTPAARQFFAVTGAVGTVWAGITYWWHNQTRW